MAQMTEDQLRAITDGEMRRAVGYWSGKLSQARQKAMQYYLCEAVGDLSPPEIDGRSSVVSPDVRNTIESMLPQLMVKFAGSEDVIEFVAKRPGDEGKAQQATDYINHIYHVVNNGEGITYTWMKDALLSKNGIIKVWWDDRFEEKAETYRGMDDVELAQLDEDDEITITESRSYPDEDDLEMRAKATEQLTAQLQQAKQAARQDPRAAQAAQQLQAQLDGLKAQPPKLLYDVTATRKSGGGKVCVENVPPEEFLISRKAKDIERAPFVGHRVLRTISELRSRGYKNVDRIGSDDSGQSLNAERFERLGYDDEFAYAANDGTDNLDESQRAVWVTECYVRVDFDGDGITELRKVVRAGGEVLENEVCDCAPFVSITPIPMPHKFFGLSEADLAMEGQRVNTSLLRALLDNCYLETNGRYFAVEGQVNLDDLLTSRPGGVVRVKAPTAVGRLDQGTGNNQVGMGMLEYMRGFVEDSTGWSRNSQGNDPDALSNPSTATQARIVTNKADMRLDLIARNFAEGFRDLFRLMLKLTSQYQDKEQVIKLRGEWVPVSPREWRNGFDCSINVGLGTGNKDQQVSHLMALIAQQQMGLQDGTAQAQNLYEARKELVKALGYKAADKYFTDPTKTPPPQQPNPDQIKAEAMLQGKQMDAQSARELKMLELEQGAQKFQADMQMRMQDIQLQHEAKMSEIRGSLELQATNDQRDAMREQARSQAQMQEKAQEQTYAVELASLKAEVDKYKADLDAQVKLTIAGQAAAPEVDMLPMQKAIEAMLEHMKAPAIIVRDKATGRALGVQKGDIFVSKQDSQGVM